MFFVQEGIPGINVGAFPIVFVPCGFELNNPPFKEHLTPQILHFFSEISYT